MPEFVSRRLLSWTIIPWIYLLFNVNVTMWQYMRMFSTSVFLLWDYEIGRLWEG